MAGLRLAHGKKIVTMDDDLQHSPDDLPALLAALGEDQDVCYAGFHNKRHALWKRAGSSFNDIMATLLLGKPKGLYLSPFKAMVSGVRDEVVKFTVASPASRSTTTLAPTASRDTVCASRFHSG
ncbi:hypothetical protein G6F65_022476 [Rhizopus arrhizus]|nr:hypothetical protein G6F65_022476 [Rhizopus arrhizus]